MPTFPNDLTDNEIRSALAVYGVTPNGQICGSIRTYIDLLLRWNRRISLTTVGDPLEIIRFHFGESVAALAIAAIEEGRLADVGTGAGFPGIPLAMVAPRLQVTLIESNTKKAAFLAETQRLLNLVNVKIFRGRFEDSPIPPVKFDFVTARALGSYSELLKWAFGALNLYGRAILWLGLKDARQIAEIQDWEWEPPHRIPKTRNRVLLVGKVCK
jgi:16S rRNA (guanine527-N7)-methyltransferase